MMTRDRLVKSLKPNQHVDLNQEDDFDTLPKAKMIANFIKSFNGMPAEINMIALYGEWGCGKTSLMKWMESDFNLVTNYKTIFFEAWKHEKDNNIALSLMDAICSQTIQGQFDKDINALKNTAGVLFKALAKSAIIDLGMLKLSGKEFVQAGEDQDNKDDKSKSFYKATKEFEEQFKTVENSILGEGDAKLIVFIDDLDRCEPECVLNLISAIKLFFSYGERTIFFCGMDKEAITKVITAKYGNVIRANEYLEKIFDVSFTIPKYRTLNKILIHYFEDFGDDKLEIIEKFLSAIFFTNPRHLKKVLNKYAILKYFKDNNIDQFELIPEMTKENSVFKIILVLFFIILHEFNLDAFIEIKEYDTKISQYIASSDDGNTGNYQHIENIKKHTFRNMKNITFKDMHYEKVGLFPNPSEGDRANVERKSNSYIIQKFLTIFTPHINRKYTMVGNQLGDCNLYLEQFQDCKKEEIILYNFCKFIVENDSVVLDEIRRDNDYKLWNLFEMVEMVL